MNRIEKQAPSNEDRQDRREEAGFSLIELLVVTVIIGVLVAMVIVSLVNALDKSKQRATMADLRTLSKAVEIYNTDTGHYPANGQTIQQLSLLLIPYQSSVVPTQDAWKHDYHYVSDNGDNYSVESFGKDGVDGPDITFATRWQFDLDIVLSNGVFTASPEP